MNTCLFVAWKHISSIFQLKPNFNLAELALVSLWPIFEHPPPPLGLGLFPDIYCYLITVFLNTIFLQETAHDADSVGSVLENFD